MTEIDDEARPVSVAAPGEGADRDPYSYQHSEHQIDPEDYGRSGEPGQRAEIGKPYVKPARLAVMLGLFTALAIWGGLPIMVLVLAVLVMIFFHELGHYVMARRAGMKVTEFMIGFGPRIFSFRRGDVEYGIKAIPAGAYVKIIGMANIEEVPADDEAQTYRQKGYWARMGVAVAGSTMHFIMAIVLIGLSFVIVGRSDPAKWGVDSIAADSAADVAGIREGDRVVAMDGVAVNSHAEMATEAQKHPGETIPVEVLRNGRTVELTATITQRFLVAGTKAEFQVYGNGDGSLSISLAEESSLVDSGLRDGDVLRSIDGAKVSTIAAARTALSTKRVADSGDVTLGVTRGGVETVLEVAVDVGDALALEKTQGFFGVGQDIVPEKLSPLEAVPASFEWFGQTTSQSVAGMARFFSPSSLAAFAQRTFSTAPGENHSEGRPQSTQTQLSEARERDGNRIVSIVGAVVLGAELTDGGWGQLLSFMAFLNMAVGILNLIPLPPFDGGHVAVGTYEKIRELLRRDGKRYFADYNKVMPVAIAVVSFMLIVGLMAIYLDLADPIKV